jgi:hypothetical protein
MAASWRDARMGWELYQDSGYSASLESLNEQLDERGFNAISERTYNHYRKLVRYGYERYIPINHLDVVVQLQELWDSPLRSRYRSRSAEIPVQLRMVLDDDLLEIPATVVKLSEAEATVHVDDEAVVARIEDAKMREGVHALVTLGDEDTRSAEIRVVQTSLDPPKATILLAFLSLVPASNLLNASPLPTASGTVHLDVGSSSFLVDLLRAQAALTDLLDSARVVCDEVLQQLDESGRLSFDSFAVERLSMSTPIEISIVGPAAPFVLVMGIIGALLLLRNRWHRGTLLKQQGKGQAIANQGQALRNVASKLDIAKRAEELVRSSAADADPEKELADLVDMAAIQDLVERDLIPKLQELTSATDEVSYDTNEAVPNFIEDESESDNKDEPPSHGEDEDG